MPSTRQQPRSAVKPPTRRYSIDPTVAGVLRRSSVTGNVLTLPPEQLDRPLYVAVDKVIRDLGGKWSRRSNGHVFPEHQPIEEELRQALGSGTIDKQLTGYFPTPPELAAELVAGADIQPEHLVLEPSAGRGALADLIVQIIPAEQLYLVESDAAHHAALQDKGYAAPQLLLADFLTTGALPAEFDRVVMNPPFERCQDVAHVQRAYSLLAPGGRLVAVMSSSTPTRGDTASRAFQALLQERRATVIANPPDAFKASGAAARTVTVVLDKP